MFGFPTGRRPWVAAFLLAAPLAGCPRVPLTLPEPVEGGVDAAQDAKVDAKADGPDLVPETGTTDANDPETGTPCDDADQDGVCDADDNCPEVANGDQTDTDKDGVGDACAPSVGCDASTSNGANLGAARLNNVELDGSGGNVVTVAPGDDVVVDFRWTATLCFMPGEAAHVVLGFDSDASQPVCAASGNCLPPTCVGSSCSDSATVKAPSAPGTYYLVGDAYVSSSCGGWNSGPPTSQSARVGAICVVAE